MNVDSAALRFLLDTSCIVPALSRWHVHHEASAHELCERLDGGEQAVVAGPTLVECFSVLTRLPAPYRTAPDAVRDALADLLRECAEVVSLNANAYRQLVSNAPEANIAGGLIYDAVVLACARQAQVDVLLTFNDRHFRALPTAGIQIVVPRASS